MGKVLSILIGLILIVLGIWAIVAGPSWKQAVVTCIQGGLVIMAVIVGLGIFVFGLSELRSGAEEPPIVEPPPGPEQPSGPTEASQ